MPYGRITAQQYGIIGIQINEERDDSPLTIIPPMRQLSFLADLCAIVLERYHLEEIADRFLIIEEQNRIANEILIACLKDFTA